MTNFKKEFVEITKDTLIFSCSIQKFQENFSSEKRLNDTLLLLFIFLNLFKTLLKKILSTIKAMNLNIYAASSKNEIFLNNRV